MGRCDEHLVYNVLFTLLHAEHALAAALLCLVCIKSHTLDVADVCICKYAVFLRNKIFNIDLTAYVFDRSTSFITVFLSDNSKFFPDDLLDLAFISKYCIVLSYLDIESSEFIDDLLSFHVGELVKLHSCDSFSLNVSQSKSFTESFLDLSNVS